MSKENFLFCHILLHILEMTKSVEAVYMYCVCFTQLNCGALVMNVSQINSSVKEKVFFFSTKIPIIRNSGAHLCIGIVL